MINKSNCDAYALIFAGVWIITLFMLLVTSDALAIMLSLINAVSVLGVVYAYRIWGS